jgi:hypothetical protein
MHQDDSEFVKCREIRFSPLPPEPDRARDAALLLRGTDGIQGVVETAPHTLTVTYDLRSLTLRIIEDGLSRLGFHLDNSLVCKLKRALFHYMEDTQRANMADHHDIKATRDIFMNRYHKLPHGCRDKRPPHWREYL